MNSKCQDLNPGLCDLPQSYEELLYEIDQLLLIADIEEIAQIELTLH